MFFKRRADGVKEFDGIKGVVATVLHIKNIMGEIAGFDQRFALRIFLDIAPLVHLVGGGFAVKGSYTDYLIERHVLSLVYE